MKKTIIFLITFMALAGWVSSASPASLQPKLAISPEVWDLGKIEGGSSYNLTYIVYNSGKAPLKIDSVRASCGCTDVKISLNKILPRQYATLKATFHSGSMSGKVEKIIYIESNAPGQEINTVKIKAEVVP